MIDVALCPDGSAVLMAHGDADDVTVRVVGDSVEITDCGGRVLAHLRGAGHALLSMLRSTGTVDVVLAGAGGIKGFAAPVSTVDGGCYA
jgi:hypothetical protein